MEKILHAIKVTPTNPMKTLTMLLIIAFLWTSYPRAEPAPLGLEIGKATVKEAKEKYKLSYAGIHRYTQGEVYDVDISKVEMKYLTECSLIFDKDKRLVAVVMTFSKSGSGKGTPEFEYYFKLLKEKYKLVESRIPFVGDTYAYFVDGNTDIILSAPHLSFTMTLIYIDRNTRKLIDQLKEKERLEERNKSKKNL